MTDDKRLALLAAKEISMEIERLGGYKYVIREQTKDFAAIIARHFSSLLAAPPPANTVERAQILMFGFDFDEVWFRNQLGNDVVNKLLNRIADALAPPQQEDNRMGTFIESDDNVLQHGADPPQQEPRDWCQGNDCSRCTGISCTCPCHAPIPPVNTIKEIIKDSIKKVRR